MGVLVRRYHRKIDPEEHQRSLDMLRKVALLLAEREVQPQLLSLDKPHEQEAETTFEEQEFVAGHNAKRYHMHFVLGWPWEELPTATTALKARWMCLSDSHCRALMSQK